MKITITNKFPLFLCLYETVLYLANDMYLPALPQITHALNTSSYYAQITLTVWFLGTTSFQFILGPISDRYGRRLVLLSSNLLFIIATITCTFTHHISLLLIGRFFQGCAVCAISVAGYAIVHELYESKEAIRIISLMASITILAPTIGPFLGSVILEISNWRIIFLILSLGGIASLVALWFSTPETNRAESTNHFNIRLLLHHYKKALKNKIFMGNAVMHGFISMGIIAWLTTSSFLIIDALHRTALFYGLIQAIIFGSFIVGTRVVQNKIATVDVVKFINNGLTLVVISAIFSLLIAILFPTFLIGFIFSLAIYAMGAALMLGAFNRCAIEASTEPMGVKMPIFSTIISIFCVLGSVFASVLYNGALTSIAFIIVSVSLLACLTKLRFL